MDKEQLMRKLKSLPVVAAIPVSIGPLRLVPGAGWQALVSLRNCSGAELSGKIGVQGAGVVGLAMVDFSIPKNGEKAFKIPVDVRISSPESVTVKVFANSKTWDFPVKVEPPAKVYPAGQKDGKPQKLSEKGSASFSASYDDSFLHLFVSVADAEPSGAPAGREPWEQDCVEVFLDAAPLDLPSKYAEAYNERIARIFVMPYAPADKRLAVWPRELEGLSVKTVKAIVESQKSGYSVSLDIPLEALLLSKPLKGKCLGFEVAVDFADAAKRQSVESWNSGGIAYKNRMSFGFLEFE